MQGMNIKVISFGYWGILCKKVFSCSCTPALKWLTYCPLTLHEWI